MYSTKALLLLSELVYMDITSEDYEQFLSAHPELRPWKAISVIDHQTDSLYGIAYQHEESEEIIFAFRGTQEFFDMRIGYTGDVFADFELVHPTAEVNQF